MTREEAINVVKNNWPDSSYTRLREALETLIPELKESEDERIRKALIEAIEQNYTLTGDINYVHTKDILAWLKKQDAQTIKEALRTEYEKGRADAIAERGKPSDEQMPTSAPVQQHVPNGVYFIFNDDCYVLASDHISMDASNSHIKAIGIAHDGHYFSVPLDWNIYGESKLTVKDSYPEDEYCMTEAEALCEWDFVKHTKHIQELGTPIKLQDGHYLPTLAVLLAMFHNKQAINNALIYAGAEEIDFDSSHFWSCLRYNTSIAWVAYGSVGFFYSYSMYNTNVCVPVSLWNPKL